MKRIILLLMLSGCSYDILPSDTSNMATTSYLCSTHWNTSYRLFAMIDGGRWKIGDVVYRDNRACSPCYCGSDGSELCTSSAPGELPATLKAYVDGGDADCVRQD